MKYECIGSVELHSILTKDNRSTRKETCPSDCLLHAIHGLAWDWTWVWWQRGNLKYEQWYDALVSRIQFKMKRWLRSSERELPLMQQDISRGPFDILSYICWDSKFGIATPYTVDDSDFEPRRGQNILFITPFQTDPEVHPTCSKKGSTFLY